VPYDELYPAGVGKAVVERTCVACHGPNFLPRRKWTEQSANAALDLMMNVSGGARERGMITPAMMSPADRQAALAYITSNFGADKPVRSTKVQEYPLDEKVLGRAMYIEYYVPLDAPGSNDSLPAGPFGRGRRTQEPHFDSDGNVWFARPYTGRRFQSECLVHGYRWEQDRKMGSRRGKGRGALRTSDEEFLALWSVRR